MLPPHRPQNAKARSPRETLKRIQSRGGDAKPLARMAFGNIRLRLKKVPATLKPNLRVLEEARS